MPAPGIAKSPGPVAEAELEELRFLALDPEPASLRNTAHGLKSRGARLEIITDAAVFSGRLSQLNPEVLLVNIELMDARLLSSIIAHKTEHPSALLYLTINEEYESVESVPEIARLGVEDYLSKPIDPARLSRMVQTGLGRPATGSTELAPLESGISRAQPYFIFRSPRMREALRDLDRIAASRETVLITGETGTGKELVAHAIHAMGPVSEGPFIPVNCGAIPESLIESELFGHEKGAFTGAHRARRGKFESAHGGTIFLDEIGDMPRQLQVKLLRVLEDGVIYRVGGEQPVKVNARVIAATQEDIEAAVEDRLFREDLYYRLNVLRINIPPLRERIEDIALLAVHFLERALILQGRPAPYPPLSPEAISLLEGFPWRGNVRELRNLISRIATLLPQDAMRVLPPHVQPHLKDRRRMYADLPVQGERPGFYVEVGSSLEEVEDRLIRETLKHTGDNRTKAARLLRMSLRTLRRKLNEPAK